MASRGVIFIEEAWRWKDEETAKGQYVMEEPEEISTGRNHCMA